MQKGKEKRRWGYNTRKRREDEDICTEAEIRYGRWFSFCLFVCLLLYKEELWYTIEPYHAISSFTPVTAVYTCHSTPGPILRGCCSS